MDTALDDRPTIASNAEGPVDGDVAHAPRSSRFGRLSSVSAESWVTFGIVACAVVFTVLQLQPGLLVASTTPAGGDMGAHVWGPAFLRDELLPRFRLSGWAPDWYAGFPAYQFYMVIPSLAILALDLVLPYGIAFKLITVSGVVLMPVAGWFLGRKAGLAFPGPALLSLGVLPFLFDTTFTIWGGNIASTLAGEFAFSISLCLALVYLGLLFDGVRTGRHRALTAVVLALVALCHLIPAVLAVVATVVILALHLGRRQIWWVLTVGVTGVALSAFWVLPFLGRTAYLNDMGWEKRTDYQELLLRGGTLWPVVLVLAGVGLVLSVLRRERVGLFLGATSLVLAGLTIALPQGRLWNARVVPFYYLCLYLLAALGVALLIQFLPLIVQALSTFSARRRAAGPDGGDGPVAEHAAPGDELDRPFKLIASAVALLAVVVMVGLPLGALPGTQRVVTEDGGVRYRWLGLEDDSSFVTSWARWNYSGYERKDSYPEYYGIVTLMDEIGRDNGCGRAMWEYDSALDQYGTPMALMLLPHWTQGCIGSMEGLYFEASATTPYHFLNQSELSDRPSRAQRDLPYSDGLDLDLGIAHLQLMGVRYYMTYTSEDSPNAVEEARAHPDLTELDTSGPWTVFEVAGSPLVEGLDHEPAVLTDVHATGEEWLEPSVEWYNDPSAWDTFLALDGPDEWQRVSVGEDPVPSEVSAAEVSDIDVGVDEISFQVDEPGTPVLVKASYFPNWQVDGAEGPYRVTPNLMVVVPTDEEVRLHYGWTPLDLLAWAITAAGLVGVVVLWRRGPLDITPPGPPVAADAATRDDTPTGEVPTSAPTVNVEPGSELPQRMSAVAAAAPTAPPVPAPAPSEAPETAPDAGAAGDDATPSTPSEPGGMLGRVDAAPAPNGASAPAAPTAEAPTPAGAVTPVAPAVTPPGSGRDMVWTDTDDDRGGVSSAGAPRAFTAGVPEGADITWTDRDDGVVWAPLPLEGADGDRNVVWAPLPLTGDDEERRGGRGDSR
ncbi:MAG: 6-pyruvoyl-tetrahydropterin synthase-related protein [Actinomycetota bacterium]|nr:6-pyruvoyl-tetrahydropterin synthase-related protein [Actinomycetota bacterium]